MSWQPGWTHARHRDSAMTTPRWTETLDALFGLMGHPHQLDGELSGQKPSHSLPATNEKASFNIRLVTPDIQPLVDRGNDLSVKHNQRKASVYFAAFPLSGGSSFRNNPAFASSSGVGNSFAGPVTSIDTTLFSSSDVRFLS